jgi:hypothetical protein
MTDAPRTAPEMPLIPFPTSFGFNPMASTSSNAHSPMLTSPSHSPTSGVFPLSTSYHTPFQQPEARQQLSAHHRSYSDTSGLSLKGLSAAQLGTDFATSQHVSGHHQRSRTTLDGSNFQLPQFGQNQFATSVPVSPITLGQISELPFLRSISHGNLQNLSSYSYDFEQQHAHQLSDKRPSSAGLVEFTALGYEESRDLMDMGHNGQY